jgi:hypothetical protein
MNRLIKASIANETCGNETCGDETEATILRWRGCANEIKQMQSDIAGGEDIHDLLLIYGLTLDDAVDVLIFDV